MGLAVAAYTLPSVAGTLVLGPVLSGCGGTQLAGWDAALRAVALGAIPVAAGFGVLGPGLYVALLAASSLLHSWGSAGRYTLIAEILLLGLIVLSFGFFFLFGPVDVALPLLAAAGGDGSATLLGTYYMVFGAGAVGGTLITGYLRRFPLPLITTGIVAGFGLVMLPLGLGAPTGVSLFCFALGGALWAPYIPTSMSLFQRHTTAADRTQVRAANGAVTVVALPVGTMLGGPLAALLGPQGTAAALRDRDPRLRRRRAALTLAPARRTTTTLTPEEANLDR